MVANRRSGIRQYTPFASIFAPRFFSSKKAWQSQQSESLFSLSSLTMSNGSSKDKLVLYNTVTLKFWACRNWQFRKMQKKKKKKERSYGSKMSKILLIIIPWLHYHSLSLKSESNKRIGNEASTMSRLSNRVWTKQQIDCTHQGHSLQSLSAVLLLVWKQVLEMSCPPGTLGALSICQNWPAGPVS